MGRKRPANFSNYNNIQLLFFSKYKYFKTIKKQRIDEQIPTTLFTRNIDCIDVRINFNEKKKKQTA